MKRILAILAACMMLTACGSAESSIPEAAAESTASTVESQNNFIVRQAYWGMSREDLKAVEDPEKLNTDKGADYVVKYVQLYDIDFELHYKFKDNSLYEIEYAKRGLDDDPTKELVPKLIDTMNEKYGESTGYSEDDALNGKEYRWEKSDTSISVRIYNSSEGKNMIMITYSQVNNKKVIDDVNL